MKRIEFTEEMDMALIHGWANGERVDSLVARLGASRSVLYRRAEELKLSHRKRAKVGRYYRAPKIYPHCHPLVRQLFEIARKDGQSLGDLSKVTGFSRETIASWGRTSNPLVPNLEAVANALDYNLVLRRKKQ